MSFNSDFDLIFIQNFYFFLRYKIYNKIGKNYASSVRKILEIDDIIIDRLQISQLVNFTEMNLNE